MDFDLSDVNLDEARELLKEKEEEEERKQEEHEKWMNKTFRERLEEDEERLNIFKQNTRAVFIFYLHRQPRESNPGGACHATLAGMLHTASIDVRLRSAWLGRSVRLR